MKTIQITLYSLALLWMLISCSGQPKSNEAAVQTMQLNDSTTLLYTQQGKQIVQQSFKALSQALLTAIEVGGVEHALQFCNVQALPITDSMAQVFQADIQRVSLKNRNPANFPDSVETTIIQLMEQKMLQMGKANDTLFVTDDGQITYMAPILMAPPCLQCHGNEGQELTTQTRSTIAALYPSDKATGYSLGDLRGMWRVRFNP